jgi:hypothetical protein
MGDAQPVNRHHGASGLLQQLFDPTDRVLDEVEQRSPMHTLHHDPDFSSRIACIWKANSEYADNRIGRHQRLQCPNFSRQGITHVGGRRRVRKSRGLNSFNCNRRIVHFRGVNGGKSTGTEDMIIEHHVLNRNNVRRASQVSVQIRQIGHIRRLNNRTQPINTSRATGSRRIRCRSRFCHVEENATK